MCDQCLYDEQLWREMKKKKDETKMINVTTKEYTVEPSYIKHSRKTEIGWV